MSKRNSDAEGSEETQNPGQEEESPDKANSVKKAILFFEKQMKGGKMKPTVGEYIRLLELEKALDVEEIKEIKVTWVEPVETESSDKK